MRAIVAFVFTASALLAQSDRVAGRWKVDVPASVFGRSELECALTLEVQVIGERLQFSYTAELPCQNEMTTLTPDGYQHTTGRPNEVASAIQLRAGLFAVYERITPISMLVSYEMWKVSEDGSKLTRQRQFRDGPSDNDSTLVFRRVTE